MVHSILNSGLFLNDFILGTELIQGSGVLPNGEEKKVVKKIQEKM
jgi:hypothetical protein